MIDLIPMSDGTYDVACAVAQYDLNTFTKLSEWSYVGDPLYCNRAKGFIKYDAYVVPRAKYIRSRIKRITTKK